jgi:hypothetical protein
MRKVESSWVREGVAGWRLSVSCWAKEASGWVTLDEGGVMHRGVIEMAAWFEI